MLFATNFNSLQMLMLILKKIIAGLCFIPLITSAQIAGTALQSKQIILQSGKKFSLQIPKGYGIAVAAEIEHRLRFLAKSPDGRLFATDMYNRGDNNSGRILIFENWNSKLRRFDKITPYLTKLRNTNQVAFYTTGNQHYIYIAQTGTIKRYKYFFGDLKPADTGTVIARYPDYGLNYKYGGWHLTRSLCFNNNKLYVSIGSSCNACIEKESQRACVIEMNPDGSGAKIYARGLRNSVALKWVNNKFWVTSMGRDQLGPDKPEDLMHTIVQNGFYGWPYYYQYNKKIYFDAAFKDSLRPKWVVKPAVAATGFKAHTAPLGFDYFKNFTDPLLNNSFLVALHGSTTVARQKRQ